MNGRPIAYFSLEIALEAAMPTYSGGLGVLAGDTVRSAADLRVPMVAVTLIYRKGYFYQRLDANGNQTEEPVEWAVDDFLEEMPERVSVTLEGRTVCIRCWKYEVVGIGGFKVPVYLLDTDLPENSEWDRTITHYLYGGDQHYRLCQEAVLGIGGVRMLRALGYKNIQRFHMNEGHSALLTLELLDEEAQKADRKSYTPDDIQAVREKCIFTTHTPVPAGHDKFPLELATRVLGQRDFSGIKDVFLCENTLNTTYIALNLSHYVNGVAKKHGEVSRLMFSGYIIDAITNGVHAATWVSTPFRRLFDLYIPGWKDDNFSLRSALNIPKQEIWEAHLQAKKQLIQYANREVNAGMDTRTFTIGFARRSAVYKRGDLLFTDVERLKNISSKFGAIQVIYAGKAHPQDQGGKDIIKKIFEAKRSLRNYIKIVYLENYDMELGKMATSGVDIWLNTPQPPFEASGTSGMKAAMNGVPSLSTLDGWWVEGHIEGITGWAIGENTRDMEKSPGRSNDALSLYDKLEQNIIPMFYDNEDGFIDVMRHTIALNGSFFNTQRMLKQYVLKAYFS
ncbi:MAG TPA: alpha-glucan family phosphorylase [Thermodesulfobacteriota bacterium]|nr:alpha-glucan family phosphorylase [Thermodesulfobacteriota bacterium]